MLPSLALLRPLPVESPPNSCDALPTGCAPALTDTPTIRSVSFSRLLMPLPTNTTALACIPSPATTCPKASRQPPLPVATLWAPGLCYIGGHTAAQAGWGDQTPEREDLGQHPSGSPAADTHQLVPASPPALDPLRVPSPQQKPKTQPDRCHPRTWHSPTSVT